MILVDSGPLIAAAIEDDRDHRRCVDMFAALHLGAEKLLVPQTVVAEVATLDHRHFPNVRPRHAEYLKLLP